MNKRILTAVFLLILILCGLFILKSSDPQEKQEIPLELDSKDDPGVAATIKEEPGLSAEEEELLERFTPEEVENLKYSHQAAQAANQNVIFYGQCLDQDDNPIEGVKVEAEVTKN